MATENCVKYQREVCDMLADRQLYFPEGGRFVRFWASEGAKFPQMEDCLPRTHVNHRAKFDATIALSSPENSGIVRTKTKQK